MPDQIVPSGGTLTLSSPLTTGTNVDFSNTPAVSGTLIIEPTAFENTTVVAAGSTVVTTYLGGAVNHFAPGDTIIVTDLATDYATFDHSPNATSQNAQVSADLSGLLLAEKFLGKDEIITISSTGAVSDNTGLLEGQTLSFLGGLVTYSLPAADVSLISGYASAIEQALFETGSVGADLFITLAADSGNAKLVDATITTDGDIVICYLAGTRIMTASGEVPIEHLAIGDLVVTRGQGVQPVKWIGRQSFSRRFIKPNSEQMPVRIEPGALGNNLPRRPLYVSAGHSMLIDGQLVLAKSLVNGVTITQFHAPDDIHYYQLEFETHDCVLAEGAWSESYADSEGMRAKFHNAAEFAALYPAYVSPPSPILCAPRPASGPDLAARLRPLAAAAASETSPGRLRGWIDSVSETGLVKGWAQDEANPNLPMLLEILVDGQLVDTVLACDHRGDLAEAGIAQGNCSFTVALPATIAPTSYASLAVRRAEDGAEIPMTPECATRLGWRTPPARRMG
jgi:hypothetical protein